MAYRIKATRIEPGRYCLSYGRGAKRVEAIAQRQKDRRWIIESGWLKGVASYPSIGDLKAAWGNVASAAYGKKGENVASLIPATIDVGDTPAPPTREASSNDDRDAHTRSTTGRGTWATRDDAATIAGLERFDDDLTDFDMIAFDRLLRRYGPANMRRFIDSPPNLVRDLPRAFDRRTGRTHDDE